VPFDIKTTEAQHYRRYVAQRRKAEGTGGDAKPQGTAEGIQRQEVIQRQAGINDGKGFVFVSHTGEIFPSGFLPIGAGNVRRDSLTEVYRHSPLFRTLRNADNLQGKCGDCKYRNLCGGSRSRSYAITGNFLAEEPRCVYEPKTAGASERKPSPPAFSPGQLLPLVQLASVPPAIRNL
jgi:radical SAM protein with 4Fe4S-binding SPASM domain